MTQNWQGLTALPTLQGDNPMPYLIIKSCVAGGSRRNAGDIVDLADAEGRSLIAMGRAENAAIVEQPKVSDRSVALDTSDALAPKKRTKRGKS
jgi:hypothetical protein